MNPHSPSRRAGQRRYKRHPEPGGPERSAGGLKPDEQAKLPTNTRPPRHFESPWRYLRDPHRGADRGRVRRAARQDSRQPRRDAVAARRMLFAVAVDRSAGRRALSRSPGLIDPPVLWLWLEGAQPALGGKQGRGHGHRWIVPRLALQDREDRQGVRRALMHRWTRLSDCVATPLGGSGTAVMGQTVLASSLTAPYLDEDR